MKMIDNPVNGESIGLRYTDAEWVTECYRVNVNPVMFTKCMCQQLSQKCDIEKVIENLKLRTKCNTYTVRHSSKGIQFFYKEER